MGADLSLSRISDILTDQILLVSPELIIKEANPSAQSVLGKGGSILGLTCYQAFRDRSEPCSDCPLQIAIESGHIKSIQYFDKRFGEFFEERVQPVVDRSGLLTSIVLTNRNVTEIRETEERSSQMKKLAAIGKLSSGAAHDFNNVIAGVLGRVHLMRKSASAALKDHLDHIEDAVQTGSETVRRMLEYAKGENTRSMELLDVTKLMDIVVFITQPKWTDLPEEKGIIVSLKTEIQEGLYLEGNKSELTNALTNLVINAVDAMPDGGVLKLTAKRRQDKVIIQVKDTGTGMTPDIVDRIFDPFFSTKGSRGTGLGLSEVFGTVRRHDALIDVKSEVGNGTTFSLEFKAAEKGPTAAQISTIVSKLSILAVDDEEYLLDTLRDILEEEGHLVSSHLKADEALDHLEHNKPCDLIITDFEMPGMNGREFAQKAKLKRPEIPIILLSGWPISLSEDEDLAQVIDAVLTKPFTVEDINQAFNSVLVQTSTGKGGASADA